MIFAHIRASFVEAFFPRWAEWIAAIVLLALGGMLHVNDTLMSGAVAAGNGRGYRLMLDIADQPTWSAILILFGIARLVILLINGAWRRSPWARAGSAFLACFFWSLIALSFAPTAGYAFILGAGWLVTDMVNIMRAMRDARTVDDAFASAARGDRGGME